MASEGIRGLYIETHNWGKSVAFWKALGYELEFETDHHSGSLRHPAAGLWIFLAERPLGHALKLYPVVIVDDAATFEAPAAGQVERPFVAQHWDVMEELLRDPDGRLVSVQAPLPKDA
ncbi:MAG: VOC family protein [Myxococcota bacterium]